MARRLVLGRNERYLFGIEHEYAGIDIAEPDKLHCFVDRRIAPGYIGWAMCGVGILQVGLARRATAQQMTANEAMTAFVAKVAPLFDLRGLRPAAVRAGMIPCGGIVRPVAAPRTLLVGDAAGMVSPLTAGGIHTALKHGHAAGQAIADHLAGRRPDPATWFVDSYPQFRAKRVVRYLFDSFQSDAVFNLCLGTKLMRTAASIVYFHHKGVFDAPRDHAQRDSNRMHVDRDDG